MVEGGFEGLGKVEMIMDSSEKKSLISVSCGLNHFKNTR